MPMVMMVMMAVTGVRVAVRGRAAEGRSSAVTEAVGRVAIQRHGRRVLRLAPGAQASQNQGNQREKSAHGLNDPPGRRVFQISLSRRTRRPCRGDFIRTRRLTSRVRPSCRCRLSGAWWACRASRPCESTGASLRQSGPSPAGSADRTIATAARGCARSSCRRSPR